MPPLILHEAVLAVAQAEQWAAAKEHKHLVVPNEFPKHPADAHLLLRGEFVAGVDRVLEVGEGAVANGLLLDLVTKVEECGARRRVVLPDDNLDKVLQSVVVVKGFNRIGVVIHSSISVNLWRKYKAFSETCNISANSSKLFYTFNINSTRHIFYLCSLLIKIGVMVTELIIVWALGVVAFFVLWAILLKVIKRISERKNPKEESLQEETVEKEISPKTLEQS